MHIKYYEYYHDILSIILFIQIYWLIDLNEAGFHYCNVGLHNNFVNASMNSTWLIYFYPISSTFRRQLFKISSVSQLHDISWQYLQCKKKSIESSNIRQARKNERLDIIRAFVRI